MAKEGASWKDRSLPRPRARTLCIRPIINISSIHFIDICYKKNCLNMNTPDRMTFTPENTTSKLIYFNKKRGDGSTWSMQRKVTLRLKMDFDSFIVEGLKTTTMAAMIRCLLRTSQTSVKFVVRKGMGVAIFI